MMEQKYIKWKIFRLNLLLLKKNFLKFHDGNYFPYVKSKGYRRNTPITNETKFYDLLLKKIETRHQDTEAHAENLFLKLEKPLNESDLVEIPAENFFL